MTITEAGTLDSETERDYFEQRAEAELELAQTATHAAAVHAHYELAGYYLDRVHNPDAVADAPAGTEAPGLPPEPFHVLS